MSNPVLYQAGPIVKKMCAEGVFMEPQNRTGEAYEMFYEIDRRSTVEARRVWGEVKRMMQTAWRKRSLSDERREKDAAKIVLNIGIIHLFLEDSPVARAWSSEATRWTDRVDNGSRIVEEDMDPGDESWVIWQAGWVLGDDVLWEMLLGVTTEIGKGWVGVHQIRDWDLDRFLEVVKKVPELKNRLAKSANKERLASLLISPWKQVREVGMQLSTQVAQGRKMRAGAP